MGRNSFKQVFYSAADGLSGCWRDGWQATDFTLWHHMDVHASGTRWHIARAVQAARSGLEAWVQFYDHDSELSEPPERKKFRNRLAEALRREGYKGKSSSGLFRKRVRTVAGLHHEWEVLKDFDKRIR